MNKNGYPLSVYNSFSEAQSSANYTGKSLIPYQCDVCGKYHLKPEAFYCEKIISSCLCVDHNGRPKATYKTMVDAEKMVNIRSKVGIKLYVYKCPCGCGFHLTSRTMI